MPRIQRIKGIQPHVPVRFCTAQICGARSLRIAAFGLALGVAPISQGAGALAGTPPSSRKQESPRSTDAEITAACAKADAIVAQLIASRPKSGWATVILRIDGPLTEARAAELKKLGADIYRRLSIIESVAVRIPSRNLVRAAGLAYVTRLSFDAPVRKSAAPGA